jgi:hypothetical protein
MRGEPDERIEPEDRNGELCSELGQCIESFDVRHLVHENESSSFLRPFFSVGW